MTPPPELEQAVLARHGKPCGAEIRFQCPHPRSHNHGDANPSATYNPAKGVWHCPVCEEGGGWKNLCELLGVSWERGGEILTTYSYTDAEGELVYEVVRKANPKGFFQRRPDGRGGWINNLKGVEPVLYRLREVVAAVRDGQRVYIVEGEKDADNLARLGLAATTNAGGAGKWRKSYSKTLCGARVAILPDNDKPGRQHAEKVAASLHGVAVEVRVFQLPDLPPGGDVSDWIARMERQPHG